MNLDDAAQMSFLDMRKGQDWEHLPAPYNDDPEALWAVAMRAASAVTRIRISLDVLSNGPGSSADRMTLLLAQMWTAGFKAGSAIAHELPPPDTKEDR